MDDEGERESGRGDEKRVDSDSTERERKRVELECRQVHKETWA